jgi:iron complex transport system substrate-binding protein
MKKIKCAFSISILLSFLIVFFFCTKKSPATIENNGITRIISASPSNTEIIVDLGLADRLVAIDSYSADVDGIPKTLPRLDLIYPDAETILTLKPDILLASELNSTDRGDDPYKLIKAAGIKVVNIPTSNTVEERALSVIVIAEALNVKEKGEQIVSDFNVQIDKIIDNIKNQQIRTDRKIYFEVSPAPYIVSFGRNTFLNDMINIAGGKNIFENENRWLTVSEEAVIAANPDIIFTNTMEIDNPIEEIKTRVGFDHINAVRNNRIYRIDVNSSSRPSLRIINALQQMSDYLNEK